MYVASESPPWGYWTKRIKIWAFNKTWHFDWSVASLINQPISVSIRFFAQAPKQPIKDYLIYCSDNTFKSWFSGKKKKERKLFRN